MLKLQGKYNEAKVFTTNVEETTAGQIIPINMRDGSIIAFGKGNADWNFSGPHGAECIMSRKKAKEVLNLEDFQNTMTAVWTTSVAESTLDEAQWFISQ